MNTETQHPRGTQARVLLTSVFGPYAQDDEFGSRALNPMELYHNQVTRVQGPFSLRMFHRSWGLMLIQANISAPSTVLDFAPLERFTEEIQQNTYDIIGISSIVMNLGKVKKMCELIREHQPECRIIVGGHIANLAGLEDRIDADHIVRGEGVAWMRRYLGEDDTQPVVHPDIVSGFGGRVMGVPLRENAGDVAAVVVPSVGCPMGCNFCSTSALFGGKGKFTNFYETGRELFDIMDSLERRLRVHSFFIMDENFLLYHSRALELLELMRKHGKTWSLYVFSSANAIQKFSMDELIGLGLSWIWLGLEGEDSRYSKLQSSRTQDLVRELQSHGIRVLGSTIIGLENHTPENIDAAIEYAVSHDTDFHQFMLYTPVPGTPLYAEHEAKGTLDPEVNPADYHGQSHFNFRHPSISREQSGEFLLRAFRRDFNRNGPSVLRIIRTLLQGWKRHHNHPEQRIRKRYRREARFFGLTFGGAAWAMEKYFRKRDTALARKVHAIREDIHREFQLAGPLFGPVVGSFIRFRIWCEERRLSRGWTYEPPTFIERRNWNAS